MIADESNGGNWFVDFKSGNKKYIVFRDKVLQYTMGNSIERGQTCEECRKMGIPDSQMLWTE